MFVFEVLCVRVCAHLHRCLKRQEAVGFPGAGTAGGSEPSKGGLNTELRFSVRILCSLNHQATSLVPVVTALSFLSLIEMVTHLWLKFYFSILPRMTENPCYWKHNEPKSFPFKFDILVGVLSLEMLTSVLLQLQCGFFGRLKCYGIGRSLGL